MKYLGELLWSFRNEQNGQPNLAPIVPRQDLIHLAFPGSHLGLCNFIYAHLNLATGTYYKSFVRLILFQRTPVYVTHLHHYVVFPCGFLTPTAPQVSILQVLKWGSRYFEPIGRVGSIRWAPRYVVIVVVVVVKCWLIAVRIRLDLCR